MITLIGPRLRTYILILLIVLAIGPTPSLAAGQGYGEDEPSLGQFVDDFTDLGNVSVAVEVIRNSTLDVMELNSSAFIPTFNISDFTETDPANRYSQTDEVSTWAGLRRGDADSRLVGDLGANYFQDSFSLYFEVNITDAEAGDSSWRSYCLILGLMNHATNYDDNRRIHIWANQRQADPNNDAVYEVFFHVRATGGAQDSDTSISVSVGTVYFMNLTRHNGGDSVRLTIKTGSHTGAVHDILDATVGVFGGEVLRYVYAPAMKQNPNDPNDWTSGTVSRIGHSLGGGFVSEGYFITTDYFDYVNGSTLALMTQSRLFPNTHITVQMSDDNTTWGDAEGIPGDSHDLSGGLETIDLRPFNGSGPYHIMFNLSTTDPAVTPYLNQSRIITTMGPSPAPGPGGPGQNVTGEWVLHNLSSILTLRGTLDSGDLNSTLDIDGDSYSVSEVVGAPGFLISFNWTAVDLDAHCLWIVINAWYDGNLAHDVDVELYNHTALAWVDLDHIVDGVGFEWFNASIYSLRIPMDFLNGAGEVWGRINHVQAGNINHDLFIEYLKLHIFIPNGVASIITTAGGVDVTSFMAIGLILALAMYLLADRVRK